MNKAIYNRRSIRKYINKKIVFIIILIFAIIWLIYTNMVVGVTSIKLSYATLPSSFNGFKIVQVSDLHNAQYGAGNKNLIKKIKKTQPDMIAITGDLIDSNSTNIEVALLFVEEISKIAPCYYVTGNHEAWVGENTYLELEKGLQELGVRILRDSEDIIEKNGDSISIIGMDDPEFAERNNGVARNMDPNEISEISSHQFTVFLSHRPEYYETYKKTDANLVLTGHAHGGQFRLPFIGGVVAPNQGLFPEYDSGVYREEEFVMVVSRGIGNSIIPVRVNNQPEIVLIELRN